MVGHSCHLSHHKMACRGRFALSHSLENHELQCSKIASTGANTRSSSSQTPEPSNPFPSRVTHLLAFHYRSSDDSALCPRLHCKALSYFTLVKFYAKGILYFVPMVIYQ